MPKLLYCLDYSGMLHQVRTSCTLYTYVFVNGTFFNQKRKSFDHELGPYPLQEICRVHFVTGMRQYNKLQIVAVEMPP